MSEFPGWVEGSLGWHNLTIERATRIHAVLEAASAQETCDHVWGGIFRRRCRECGLPYTATPPRPTLPTI